MSGGRYLVGRRPVLVGAVAVVAGCDAAPDTSSTPSPGGTSATPSGDGALTTTVTTALAEATMLAEAIAEEFPGMRGLAMPFARLHRSHAAMLGGLPTAARPRVRRPRARRDLLRRERQLQRELVDAARTAESGALAQALAAMAAAVAQRRAVTQ